MAGTSQQFVAHAGFTDSGKADGAIKAFRFLTSTTTGMSDYLYKAATAATNAAALGVATADAADGEPCGICFGGVGIVEVNADSVSILPGDYIGCIGNDGIGGKIDLSDGGVAHARALEPANEDGVCIRVLILPGIITTEVGGA